MREGGDCFLPDGKTLARSVGRHGLKRLPLPGHRLRRGVRQRVRSQSLADTLETVAPALTWNESRCPAVQDGSPTVYVRQCMRPDPKAPRRTHQMNSPALPGYWLQEILRVP